MSETITFDNGATATIYGTSAGALAYLGAETTDWDDVATDESLQRLLVKARRLLDLLPWADDYDTFAERDAVTAIVNASYILADAGLDDEGLLTVDSSISDVASMSAGGASISYRNEQRASASDLTERLPQSVLMLIGPYLASDTGTLAVTSQAGSYSEGSDTNPFGPDADFDRNESW